VQDGKEPKTALSSSYGRPPGPPNDYDILAPKPGANRNDTTS
jgi:hypothetical protein